MEFEGEVGLDRGGLAKEMFTIAIRDLIRKTEVLSSCANGRIYWFTEVDGEEHESKSKQAKITNRSPGSQLSSEFILGLLAGLAVYNGVYIDLPLPSSIYKLMKKREVSQTLLSNIYNYYYNISSVNSQLWLIYGKWTMILQGD